MSARVRTAGMTSCFWQQPTDNKIITARCKVFHERQSLSWSSNSQPLWNLNIHDTPPLEPILSHLKPVHTPLLWDSLILSFNLRMGYEPLHPLKDERFIDQMRDYRLLTLFHGVIFVVWHLRFPHRSDDGGKMFCRNVSSRQQDATAGEVPDSSCYCDALCTHCTAAPHPASAWLE